MTDDIKTTDAVDASENPIVAVLGAIVHVWDDQDQPTTETLWRLNLLIDAARDALLVPGGNRTMASAMPAAGTPRPTCGACGRASVAARG